MHYTHIIKHMLVLTEHQLITNIENAHVCGHMHTRITQDQLPKLACWIRSSHSCNSLSSTSVFRV